MEFLLITMGLCIGIAIGYSVLPRVKQKTKVTITDTEVSFESNRLQDGDVYEIQINDNVVSKGIVNDKQWVTPTTQL